MNPQSCVVQDVRLNHYGSVGGFVNEIHPSESFQCDWTPSHHDFAGISDLNSDLSAGTDSTDPCAQRTRSDRSGA